MGEKAPDRSKGELEEIEGKFLNAARTRWKTLKGQRDCAKRHSGILLSKKSWRMF
jgi:hypothetical protein